MRSLNVGDYSDRHGTVIPSGARNLLSVRLKQNAALRMTACSKGKGVPMRFTVIICCVLALSFGLAAAQQPEVKAKAVQSSGAAAAPRGTQPDLQELRNDLQ